MRAVLAVIAGLALCSCTPEPQPLADEPPPVAPLAAVGLGVGDGWIVNTNRQTMTDGTELFMCSAMRADATGSGLVTIYMPGESQVANPTVNLMFAVPADRLPSPVGLYYALAFPGTNDMIPIDGHKTKPLDQYSYAFYSAEEFEPKLTQLLSQQRSVSLVQTDRNVTTERVVASVDIPYAGAIRAALMRCEATGGAEQPTRAAYLAHRR